jgi:hypothetical protein
MDDASPGKVPSATRHYRLGFEVGGSQEDPYIRRIPIFVTRDQLTSRMIWWSIFEGDGVVVMTSGGGGGALADEVIRGAGSVYGFPALSNKLENSEFYAAF